jgi:hypothetical protein
MKKELRPFHDHVTCTLCGRTMLKGERTEAYLAPEGERHLVCELCFVRADSAGWIRESGSDHAPARPPRPQKRRPILSLLRRRAAAPVNGRVEEPSPVEQERAEPIAVEAEPAPVPPVPRERPRERRQDPRHVRAVPTTAEVKVERALELFNASEHQRTIAGLARSLGVPWVTAIPDRDAPSTVTVIVAWELSWYRYRVDLGDAAHPVALQEKGDEIEAINDDLRGWNAGLDADGNVVTGVAQE